MKLVKLNLVLLCAGLLCVLKSVAQTNNQPGHVNPPVDIEFMPGNRGALFQMILNKKVVCNPRFGVFAVSNILGEWGDKNKNEYMTQVHLTYELFKGFNLQGGFHVTNMTGFRPTTGMSYAFANREWLVVLNPRIDLSKSANWEILNLIEFKPEISEKWKLYTRSQLLYGATVANGDHGRSYAMLRAGVTRQDFTFGIGANFDQYGPMKVKENSLGVFLIARLF